jgi:hypothetical protein
MADDMSGEGDDVAADAALFAQLRAWFERSDPVPAGLTERMTAFVALEDRSRRWDLLPLLEGAGLAAVRGEGDTLTLQFGDGSTNVLLHVSATDDGRRRVDGWTDASALAVRLSQGDRRWLTEPSEAGRFAFEGIAAGSSRLWVVRTVDGATRAFMTEPFEI